MPSSRTGPSRCRGLVGPSDLRVVRQGLYRLLGLKHIGPGDRCVGNNIPSGTYFLGTNVPETSGCSERLVKDKWTCRQLVVGRLTGLGCWERRPKAFRRSSIMLSRRRTGGCHVGGRLEYATGPAVARAETPFMPPSAESQSSSRNCYLSCIISVGMRLSLLG